MLAEVRELAQVLIAPGAARIDRESRFPDEQLSALAQVGALGLLVPCEHGGVGAGLVALADACEAVGGACASTGMVFLMHRVTAATVAGGGGPSAARLLPRIVTIWERFRTYFADAGVPTDYVLFSNYERLVDAVLDTTVEIGWNTNTAYVALDHRAGARGAGTRILGMRDVDRDWATVVVTRKGQLPAGVTELNGRVLALGSRDSGHAAILPLHYLTREGLDVASCRLVRFDTDIGKHGDTGDSELHVVRAVAEGEADAGALSAAYFSAFRAESVPAVADLEVAWRSPAYYHCNFTVLDSLDREISERWSQALLAMDDNDPSLRPAMELEGFCSRRRLSVSRPAAFWRSERRRARSRSSCRVGPDWPAMIRSTRSTERTDTSSRFAVAPRPESWVGRSRRARLPHPFVMARCTRLTGAAERSLPSPIPVQGSLRSERCPRPARPHTTGRSAAATRSGPTTSASSSTKPPPSSGTPPATSPGRPLRAWMTRPSAPFRRS